MNISEKLSLSSGLKINKPFIYERFFPPPSQKYILVENNSRPGLFEYKSFDELSAIIFPFLAKENIEIFQYKINPQDSNIFRVKQLNKIPLQQLNNLIKHSSLIITNNPYTAHISNVFNVKNIFLHKEELYPLHTPQYSNSTTTIKGGTNCFPELICKEILKTFEIDSILSKINPIYKGKKYEQKRIECVPDFDIKQNPIKDQFITIRADLHFNLQNILNLIMNNQSVLKCNQIPNLKYLTNPSISKNLKEIIYEVFDTTTEKEMSNLNDLNKPVTFFTKDEENLNKIRLKHIDYSIDFTCKNKNLDKLKSLCNNKIYYKSSKVIMSNNNQYSSETNWKKNIQISNSFEEISPSEDFAQELEEFKLFQLND